MRRHRLASRAHKARNASKSKSKQRLQKNAAQDKWAAFDSAVTTVKGIVQIALMLHQIMR